MRVLMVGHASAMAAAGSPPCQRVCTARPRQNSAAHAGRIMRMQAEDTLQQQDGKRSRVEGEDYVLVLGRLKRLTLRIFKGRLLIDFREFWQVCRCARGCLDVGAGSVIVWVGVDNRVVFKRCCKRGLEMLQARVPGLSQATSFGSVNALWRGFNVHTDASHSRKKWSRDLLLVVHSASRPIQ